MKYTVTWNTAPNSCGINHTIKVSTIKQVMFHIEEHLNSRYSAITVFDSLLDDFVFWKDCMETPWINLLTPHKHNRDLRTKNRKQQ